MRLTEVIVALVVAGARASSNHTSCKSTPLDATWPSDHVWAQLNNTVDGRLLRPLPPAASCHADEPNYDSATCTAVTAQWTTYAFHEANPISIAWNNFNNDSCLPDPAAPCSGTGYPVYVINATSSAHVQAGVRFARQHNIRINVKASGHDFLGRNSAPYSLSVWTHHLRQVTLHDTFTPQHCATTIDTTAVTVGAGSSVDDLYTLLQTVNQTAVDGLGPEVTVGGYLTGGGHSPLSPAYGLGADQVYEIELVTPTGDLVVANECQNEDLFWAMRGGGGSTFGVMTAVTIKTLPTMPVSRYTVSIVAPPNGTAYWDVVAQALAMTPDLAAANVSAYIYLYPNITTPQTGNLAAGAMLAVYQLPSPATPRTLRNLVQPLLRYAHTHHPLQTIVLPNATQYADFYTYYQDTKSTDPAGGDLAMASRLLDAAALTGSRTRLIAALKTFTASGMAILHAVSGPGVFDAQPRGGSDAVLPAWRSSYVHAVTTVSWTALDETAEATQTELLTNVYNEALRELAPNTGSYINEADVNEPDFQQAFWGANYARLAQIKQRVDPDNVFWCHPCVGNEGWELVDNKLCPVSG